MAEIPHRRTLDRGGAREDEAIELARQFDGWSGPSATLRSPSGPRYNRFGAPDPHGFTSRFDHWRYAPEQPLAATSEILAGLIDMRIPLAMSNAQATQIVSVVQDSLRRTG